MHAVMDMFSLEVIVCHYNIDSEDSIVPVHFNDSEDEVEYDVLFERNVGKGVNAHASSKEVINLED
jgi:hypothetical protein